MLTRASFEVMDEAGLREEIIKPVLRAMGYKDVFLYHGGAGEQGKDIVCWKADDLGCRENLAVVAKAVQMSGKAKLDIATAAEVQTQIRQCFGKSYTAPVSSEEQSVHRVWVVSNKKITKEAQEAIKSAVGTPEITRNVRFVDADTLWGLVEAHLLKALALMDDNSSGLLARKTAFRNRLKAEIDQNLSSLKPYQAKIYGQASAFGKVFRYTELPIPTWSRIVWDTQGSQSGDFLTTDEFTKVMGFYTALEEFQGNKSAQIECELEEQELSRELSSLVSRNLMQSSFATTRDMKAKAVLQKSSHLQMELGKIFKKTLGLDNPIR